MPFPCYSSKADKRRECSTCFPPFLFIRLVSFLLLHISFFFPPWRIPSHPNPFPCVCCCRCGLPLPCLSPDTFFFLARSLARPHPSHPHHLIPSPSVCARGENTTHIHHRASSPSPALLRPPPCSSCCLHINLELQGGTTTTTTPAAGQREGEGDP